MDERLLRILAASPEPADAAAYALLSKLEDIEAKLDGPKKKNGNGGFYVPGKIAGLLIALLMACLLALASTVVDVRGIKDTRFRDTDGQAMEARMQEYHNSRTPPPEVTRRLNALEAIHNR